MSFERLTDSGPQGAGLGAFAEGKTPKQLGAARRSRLAKGIDAWRERYMR